MHAAVWSTSPSSAAGVISSRFSSPLTHGTNPERHHSVELTSHSRGSSRRPPVPANGGQGLFVDTAVISYRVADFLERYPPFNAIDEADRLALAARGRVRFHEPHEYVLWQGEPHRHQVFVIQQGSVSLWDETAGEPRLRDVRG